MLRGSCSSRESVDLSKSVVEIWWKRGKGLETGIKDVKHID